MNGSWEMTYKNTLHSLLGWTYQDQRAIFEINKVWNMDFAVRRCGPRRALQWRTVPGINCSR